MSRRWLWWVFAFSKLWGWVINLGQTTSLAMQEDKIHSPRPTLPTTPKLVPESSNHNTFIPLDSLTPVQKSATKKTRYKVEALTRRFQWWVANCPHFRHPDQSLVGCGEIFTDPQTIGPLAFPLTIVWLPSMPVLCWLGCWVVRTLLPAIPWVRSWSSECCVAPKCG